MSKRKITINPVSRIEGHGKVVIHLDEQGEVDNAEFMVTQYRGFEVFTAGRPFEEMPVITQRICGICPVSHQLASAKACDAILGGEIPIAAKLLRELLHMGQYIQSHALHFFYLASPDLLLGWDEDPATRNVVGVVGRFPEAAKQGIFLRKFGQEIIKALGGKRIHPAFAQAGGVSNPLLPRERERLLSNFRDAYRACRVGLDLCKGWVEANLEEVREFASFESLYMGLVDEQGRMNLYDGRLRMVDSAGDELAHFKPADYLAHLAEHVEPWSYLKFPYYQPLGYPKGIYRVGPLGRLMAASGLSTAKAQKEWEEFRKAAAELGGGSLLYHYARLIEALYALERAEELLCDGHICETDVKMDGAPRNEQGVGVIEAPRGTLIHHYWVDENGAILKANLIVATGHNNLAMNQAVTKVAQKYIHGDEVAEGVINRVEGAIRCYDPCLSCSTHALGRMPLILEVRGPSGELGNVLKRN